MPKKRTVRVNLDTCCHHRWQTVGPSHLTVNTFVRQPHDITHILCILIGNAAIYSSHSNISVVVVNLNSCETQLSSLSKHQDKNGTAFLVLRGGRAKHAAIATCSSYLFIVMLAHTRRQRGDIRWGQSSQSSNRHERLNHRFII